MRRVVHNLMINAIQATVAGKGKVTVRTDTGEGMVNLAITDNGSGIPTDRLAMVFEPYYSTKDNGTGLGLAISRRIVKEHEGTLTAESVVGSGSTFTVRLPWKNCPAKPDPRW